MDISPLYGREPRTTILFSFLGGGEEGMVGR